MKRVELAFGISAALVFGGAAEGQRGPPPFDPVQTETSAELAAGSALMEAGEQYLVAGFSGPDSKSCRLIKSAIQHFNIAASITKKERALVARDRALLEKACRGP